MKNNNNNNIKYIIIKMNLQKLIIIKISNNKIQILISKMIFILTKII